MDAPSLGIDVGIASPYASIGACDALFRVSTSRLVTLYGSKYPGHRAGAAPGPQRAEHRCCIHNGMCVGTMPGGGLEKLRAFEFRQQPLRLEHRQAEAVGEVLARVRARPQLVQVGDLVRALALQPRHRALKALRVRVEADRLEQRLQARGRNAMLQHQIDCQTNARGAKVPQQPHKGTPPL